MPDLPTLQSEIKMANTEPMYGIPAPLPHVIFKYRYYIKITNFKFKLKLFFFQRILVDCAKTKSERYVDDFFEVET